MSVYNENRSYDFNRQVAELNSRLGEDFGWKPAGDDANRFMVTRPLNPTAAKTDELRTKMKDMDIVTIEKRTEDGQVMILISRDKISPSADTSKDPKIIQRELDHMKAS